LDPFYVNLPDYMTGSEEISAPIMTGIFELLTVVAECQPQPNVEDRLRGTNNPLHVYIVSFLRRLIYTRVLPFDTNPQCPLNFSRASCDREGGGGKVICNVIIIQGILKEL